MDHSFTPTIRGILSEFFGERGQDIFNHSLLIQYLNEKTKSANKGSKSRSSFANLYAIYVIVEDYISGGFNRNKKYKKYEGAQFSKLLQRQRQLPFGSKMQNHALNNRTNAEFQKYFPTTDLVPILRNLETNRYWINENLINVKIGNERYNIAEAIIKIIDKYISVKKDSFQRFIEQCEALQNLGNHPVLNIREFVASLLAPNVDARLFEIVSYSILKHHYTDQSVIWGYTMDTLTTESLKLYKTGRTNANDGGIDFVMKPLGRFFQVTETLDFKKYFLDIEKIEKYPVTFVIKSDENIETLQRKLYDEATKDYVVESIVNKYLSCIEDIINIPQLLSYLSAIEQSGRISDVLAEIVLQSKVEFNYDE